MRPALLSQVAKRTGASVASLQQLGCSLPVVDTNVAVVGASSSSCTGRTSSTLSAVSSSAGFSGAPWWAAAAGAATAAAAFTATCAAADDSAVQPSVSQSAEDAGATGGRKLLSLSQRKRIFLKYEKRIRDMSDLAKVFEYFATEVRDGVRYMDARGVVRALVPTYPPHDSTVERAGYLDGEHVAVVEARTKEASIFQYFDTDGDGFVSFAEFVLVVVLMTIPENDVRTVFSIVDTDDSGTIDEEEFMTIMRMLERQSGVQSRHHQRPGRTSYDNTEAGISGMMKLLFDKDQGHHMDIKKFQLFLSQLHADLVKLEFGHYDADGDGLMYGVDMGASLVTAASIKQVDHFLNKVESMPPELARAKFTAEQFAQIGVLRRRLHELAVALHFCQEVGRPVTRQEFVRLLKKTIDVTLAPSVVDVIMHVFSDAHGNLDGLAFVEVMKRRQRMPGQRIHDAGASMLSEGTTDGPFAQLAQWWACVKGCTKSDDWSA